jgi:Domain of unknown function (DUF4062)
MKIYLSSSYAATETELVRARLERLDCVFVIDRSMFGARSGPLNQVIISDLTRSDLFIGFVGPDYGAVDQSLGVSICEFEYREALLLGVPRLLYIENSFTTEPQAAAFRNLIETNDLPARFHDTSVLLTQVVTDVFNFTFRGPAQKTTEGPGLTAATSEAESATQSIKDPEAIEWYKSWKTWFARNIFPRSPILRGILQAVVIPILTVAAFFKLYGVPKPLGDAVDKLNANIAILFGGDPRHSHDSIQDSFAEPSLDPIKWNSGRSWNLIGLSSPTLHDTLVITGSDVGTIRVPDNFESYYDMTLSFQVPVSNPLRQRSLAWLVRLQHSWRGDSYYRFDLTFPTSDDQHLHLLSSLYLKGIFRKSFGERTVPLYPFARKGSSLNVITILNGSSLNVSVRYNDSCIPPCAEYNDGTKHDFVFDDPQHTLKWGAAGFTNSAGNPETDIQDFELVPAGEKQHDS